MPARDKKTPKKRSIIVPMLAVLLLLVAAGSVALYQLGKPDPADPVSLKLAWGDRVEKRLDALIDGSRPSWADSIEARVEAFGERIGWK